MGVWGKTWNRAVVLRGRRGFRVFPQHAVPVRANPALCGNCLDIVRRLNAAHTQKIKLRNWANISENR
jgi:hypothetical protein